MRLDYSAAMGLQEEQVGDVFGNPSSQVREDGGSDQRGISRDDEKWSDVGYILTL